MKLLEHSGAARADFLGAALAILGALALAADKGALCLTMSALHKLSDAEFSNMMPGLLAMFSKRGWPVLLWGITLLPIGFGIQTLALLKTRSIARWQSLLLWVTGRTGDTAGAETRTQSRRGPGQHPCDDG